MQPALLFILYATSYHEQTGDIINFAQFEEGNLVENECNVSEYEYILASIDESSTDNDYYDLYTRTYALEDIQYGKYVHPNINARDTRLKIRDRIRKKNWMKRSRNLIKEDGQRFT